MGYNVSLRRSEAAMINVVFPNNGYQPENTAFSGTIEKMKTATLAGEKGKNINVALVGKQEVINQLKIFPVGQYRITF